MAENGWYMESFWLSEFDKNWNDKFGFDEFRDFLQSVDKNRLRNVMNDREFMREQYDAMSEDFKGMLIDLKTFDTTDARAITLLQVIWNIDWNYSWELDWKWNTETQRLFWEVFSSWELEIVWLKTEKEPISWLKMSEVTYPLESENKSITLLDDELFSCYKRFKAFNNTEPLENYFSEKWLQNPGKSIQELDQFLQSFEWLKLYDFSDRYGNLNWIADSYWVDKNDKKEMDKLFVLLDWVNASSKKIASQLALQWAEIRAEINKTVEKNKDNPRALMWYDKVVEGMKRPFRAKIEAELRTLAFDSWMKLLELNPLPKQVTEGKKINLWEWESNISLDFWNLDENNTNLKANFEANFDEIFRESFSEKTIDWIVDTLVYAWENPIETWITVSAIIAWWILASLSWPFAIWLLPAWVSSTTQITTWIAVAWATFTATDNAVRGIWTWIFHEWPFWEWFKKWVWYEDWKVWDFAFDKATELISNTALFWIFKWWNEVAKLFSQDIVTQTIIKWVNIPTEALFFNCYNIMANSWMDALKWLSIWDSNLEEAIFMMHEMQKEMNKPENFSKDFTVNLGLIIFAKMWMSIYEKWSNKISNIWNKKAWNKEIEGFVSELKKSDFKEFDSELAKLKELWYNLDVDIVNQTAVFRDKKWDLIDVRHEDFTWLVNTLKSFRITFEEIVRKEVDKKADKNAHDQDSWRNGRVDSKRIPDSFKNPKLDWLMLWLKESIAWETLRDWVVQNFQKIIDLTNKWVKIDLEKSWEWAVKHELDRLLDYFRKNWYDKNDITELENKFYNWKDNVLNRLSKDFVDVVKNPELIRNTEKYWKDIWKVKEFIEILYEYQKKNKGKSNTSNL